MSDHPEIYERLKLCEGLTAEYVCFVVEQYSEGVFERKFHEHVRASRTSNESRAAILRALVAHFGSFSAEHIMACYLNKRGSEPAYDSALEIRHTCYSEPGVLRHYCGANTSAWCDFIFSRRAFRQPERKEECI
jgi:hypothetical protein